MFGLWSPVSYYTNFSSALPLYYSGFWCGNYNPFVLFLNSPWMYRNIVKPNINNPYQCNDYNNIFAANQLSQYSFKYSDDGIFNYLPQTQVMQPALSEYPSMLTNTDFMTAPAITPAIQTETTIKPEKTETIQATQMFYKKIDLGDDFVKTAKKYYGCKESDGSHLKFCINQTCKVEDPYNQEWCTDFVTYVVNETYKKEGMTVPSGFGSHDVKTLKNWAIDTNHFIRTSNKSKKAEYISQNIKPGDIIIFNENNASHTGFVTQIDKNDGTIHTIEGNRNDKVSNFAYSPDLPEISGFIRLTS